MACLRGKEGCYEVLDRLGTGGTADVHLARRAGDAEPRFAVKRFVPPGRADAAREAARHRFTREGAILLGVVHPNLAHVCDWVSEEDGGPCVVMDLVVGTPLDADLAARGAYSLREVAALVAQVGDALDFLHRLPTPVVHRDVKPKNIILAGVDGARRAVLVDFGAAKQLGIREPGVTGPGAAAAPLTYEYASPEQFDADEAGPQSDVFSLGMVTAELLTGRLPYPEYRSDLQLMAVRASGRIVPLAEVRPDGDWPEGLQGVLNRALAPSPADRFASAGEFAGELTRIAQGDGGLGADRRGGTL